MISVLDPTNLIAIVRNKNIIFKRYPEINKIRSVK